ncbi:MAG: carboxypeptidase M32 [Candidatus Asgardarchaeia archaeon]
MFEVFENKTIKEILNKYLDIWSIGYASGLLGWDSETYMPKESIKERSIVFGRLAVLRQKMMLSSEFKDLVKKGEKEQNLNDYEAGVIRVLKREIERFEKLPPEFIEEMERVTSKARVVWREAKAKSDYNMFKPYLGKIFELSRKAAEYLGYEEHPYDALLDLYEEGLKTREVDSMFKELGPQLRDFLKKIIESQNYSATHPLEETQYDIEKMKALNTEILKLFKFPFERGRIDVSAHPFTSGFGVYDVRITTRYEGKDFRRSLLAVIHEFGHALYELQIDEKLMATPIAGGVSLGVHESQSRFWENMIGRSKAFTETNFELFKKYLDFLKDYTPDDVYRYFNIVKPDFIRVEADEVTYNQHILIRFEIEKGVMEEKINVDELPQIWNSLMEKYLGITPPNDALGVLQDIHWSMGSTGYFPTYSIGTILATQIAVKLEKELGNLSELITEKKYDEIKSWLKEKFHRWGSTYPPKELIKRALGEEMNPKYFIEHLKRKYSEIYSL